MSKGIRVTLSQRIGEFFLKRFKKIREINKRYEKSSIKMTPAVRISLLFLRIYLIFLVVVLVYKFVTLVR